MRKPTIKEFKEAYAVLGASPTNDEWRVKAKDVNGKVRLYLCPLAALYHLQFPKKRPSFDKYYDWADETFGKDWSGGFISGYDSGDREEKYIAAESLTGFRLARKLRDRYLKPEKVEAASVICKTK